MLTDGEKEQVAHIVRGTVLQGQSDHLKFSNFLTNLPFPRLLLPQTFQLLHEWRIEQFPNWSLLASRRKPKGWVFRQTDPSLLYPDHRV